MRSEASVRAAHMASGKAVIQAAFAAGIANPFPSPDPPDPNPVYTFAIPSMNSALRHTTMHYRPASLSRALAAIVLAIAGWQSAHAGKVLVAVAANFTAPMRKIAADFAADTGHQAELAFGATGKFYAQIVHGAPFEVLLAADEATPARLEREGLALANTRFTYALGTLVLWSAQPGLVDAQGAVLGGGQFKHLALANPKLAPYGAAAVQVLQKLGVEQAVQPRLLQGESVAQVFQWVASGNAELGFVALSQVLADGKSGSGSLWRVPAGLHAPIRQDAALLTPGKDNAAAIALLQYLRGDKARAVIEAFGYGL